MEWSRSLTNFLFPIRSSSSITILRSGLGLSVIFFCLSFPSSWSRVFAGHGNGLIDRNLTESIAGLGNPLAPRLSWFVTLGSWGGLSEGFVLWVAYAALLLSGFCLLLGFLSRIAALTAWFVYLAAVTSGGLASYGVDQFMAIGLFYVAISPLPRAHLFKAMLLDPTEENGWQFGFFQRVLQLHLCLIYFFGGLAKCLGVGWWNGDSIWRALTRPPFNTIPPQVLVGWSAVFPIIGILVCLIETFYPVFIWPRTTRDAWLLLVLGMHLAIAATMGMYLFGLIMIVLNCAAYGPGSALARVGGRLLEHFDRREGASRRWRGSAFPM